jgi:hypothetical protein
MELGFQRSYFFDLLGRAGWALDHSFLDTTFWANLYTARRFSDKYRWPMRFDCAGDALATEIGRREGSLIVSDGIKAGFVQFGPYANVPAGMYKANWWGRIEELDRGVRMTDLSFGQVDATTQKGSIEIAKGHFSSPKHSDDAAGQGPVAMLEFSLNSPTTDLELRLYANRGVRVTLSHITLDRVAGSD